MCPVLNCFKVTKNIGEHLKCKAHNLKPKKECYAFLKLAAVYKEVKLSSESPKKTLLKFKSLSSRNSFDNSLSLNIPNPLIADNSGLPRKANDILTIKMSALPQLASFNTKSELENTDYDNDDVANEENDGNDSDYLISEYETEINSVEPIKVKLSPYVESLLDDFYNFYTGPDRARSGRSIERVKDDVKRILLAVNITSSINVIFENNTDIIRHQYLQLHSIKRKLGAGSIKTYLNSLKDFSPFLVASRNKIPNLPIENVHEAIINIENWKKKFKAKEGLQKHKKAEDDFKMLVTPAKIKMNGNSKNALFAKELQESLKIDNIKPKFEYCSYRDHVFFYYSLFWRI
ncbi:uncharacterized protein LOC124817795 [Hydra vulgaris]|uniref:uncharacterized protein LOC124817795 n=1 Tax=Hydra vulgaris TaxID=6087 RepID=UPI001F5E76C5|nr:uncharacterized protein LOC124817795 isoform X1 [Hydra vulgaris]